MIENFSLEIGKKGDAGPGADASQAKPELYPVVYSTGVGYRYTAYVDETTSRLLMIAKAAGAAEAAKSIREAMGIR